MWIWVLATILLVLVSYATARPKKVFFGLIALLDDVHKIIWPVGMFFPVLSGVWLNSTAMWIYPSGLVIPTMYEGHFNPSEPVSDRGKLRIVCISDTHNCHGKIAVPDGDVLIHAGDFTYRGTAGEIEAFNSWLGTLPHKHKVWIGVTQACV